MYFHYDTLIGIRNTYPLRKFQALSFLETLFIACNVYWSSRCSIGPEILCFRLENSHPVSSFDDFSLGGNVVTI